MCRYCEQDKELSCIDCGAPLCFDDVDTDFVPHVTDAGGVYCGSCIQFHELAETDRDEN